MACAPSRFERMITNNGPVQTSIIRNLTRWEFRNLQLAGVRISVGRVFRRKHQIPTRCDECNPEEEEQLLARCTNSTQTFDEIRACSGSPFFSQGKLRENSISDQEIQDCLQTEPWWGEEDSPENGPNTDKHPIHTKVCRRCRDWYVANEMFHQVLTIAEFRTPLCKRHSLEQANQSPLNACHCFNYINDLSRERENPLVSPLDISHQSLGPERGTGMSDRRVLPTSVA
ncbi:hypothetical protein MMC22_002253 [Lobaria immixta]|nr:hypothetical protein [Lobaria immixta]